MIRFNAKTVLVTGGNSGIGLAAAKAYAAEGARVVITGRDESTLAKAKAELGANTIAIVNDVSAKGAPAALAQAIAREGVMLDAVFVNAGTAKFGPFDAIDEATWDASFDTNVKGAYFQLQALLPFLNRGASIVLNGSINAHIGMPNSSVYAASKAALVSLARTLSAELLPRGVRVNVVSPGPVSTPLHERFAAMAAPGEHVAQVQAQIPLGRFGTPEELASTIVHLSAAESAYIVGTEIIVDGGMSQL